MPAKSNQDMDQTTQKWAKHVEHHERTQWVQWFLIFLGFWLVAGALSFYSPDSWVNPPERALWGDPFLRANLLRVNDFLCGIGVLIFGWRALRPQNFRSLWGASFIGIWLQFAPLLFWSPDPVVYLNDTLVGVLIILLSILIPGMPGMILMMEHGPELPSGWSYNPSSWPQRWIMVALGVLGWLVSRYLAAYQLGYLDQVWDPFFGDGTRRVLLSSMSKSWPISDAGLGAVTYTLEALMGVMGGRARWRTMPWMVTFFGILVIPLGLTHIILVISQPLVVGQWCSLCLLAALIMLPMIPLEVDEVVAMGQFLRKSVKEGNSFWKVFWYGGTIEGEKDHRSPELLSSPFKVAPSMFLGVSIPWNLFFTTVFGVILMLMPTWFAWQGKAAHNLHLVGALIVTISVISMAEVIRTLRLLNVVLGGWIILSPWLFLGEINTGSLICSALGVPIFFLSFFRGRITENYGTWNTLIK